MCRGYPQIPGSIIGYAATLQLVLVCCLSVCTMFLTLKQKSTEKDFIGVNVFHSTRVNSVPVSAQNVEGQGHQMSTSNFSKACETRNSFGNSCSQVVLVYLRPFRCNSLLKRVLQLKIAEKLLKPSTLGVHGRSRLSSSSFLASTTKIA